jgi:hypothetical protein
VRRPEDRVGHCFTRDGDCRERRGENESEHSTSPEECERARA